MVADTHLEQEEISDDGEVAWKSIIYRLNQINTIKVLEEVVVVAVTVAEKPGEIGGTAGPGETVGPGGRVEPGVKVVPGETGVVPVGRMTRVYSYHSSGPYRRS